jgi:hypothetical protein
VSEVSEERYVIYLSDYQTTDEVKISSNVVTSEVFTAVTMMNARRWHSSYPVILIAS